MFRVLLLILFFSSSLSWAQPGQERPFVPSLDQFRVITLYNADHTKIEKLKIFMREFDPALEISPDKFLGEDAHFYAWNNAMLASYFMFNNPEMPFETWYVAHAQDRFSDEVEARETFEKAKTYFLKNPPKTEPIYAYAEIWIARGDHIFCFVPYGSVLSPDPQGGLARGYEMNENGALVNVGKARPKEFGYVPIGIVPRMREVYASKCAIEDNDGFLKAVRCSN